jgi:tetratricopeptide (TPR) repeat protein
MGDAAMEALDFQVDVSAGGERGYEVTARAPQGGEAAASMRLPLSPRELEALVARIKDAVIASSATVRRSLTNEERPVQQLGRMLFDSLLADNVRGLLLASRQRAAQEGSRLRLVLRVRPPELARLPWEFLFDASEDDYICLNTPLIRYPTVLQPQLPIRVDPPLRILGMVARPGDQRALAIDDEKSRLDDALAELKRDGQITLSWVPGQTWRALQAIMHRGPWHVFHFIGHGGFDAAVGEGTLALADDTGRTYHLGAKGLAMLLRDHPSLRLVLLNACDTGRASALDPFSSVAGALMRRGIPAVLAMQFEITDLAAIEFSRTFYGAIAHQLPVDVSVTQARQAIQLASPGTLEWGTPVLYLRSPAGYIFDLTNAPSISDDFRPPSAPPPVAKEEVATKDTEEAGGRLDDHYAEGLTAFDAERWDEAVEIFRTIVAHKRDYKDASLRLEQARRQQQLAARYTKAAAAADAARWAEAIKHFKALLAAEPDYRDAKAQLARAREQAAARSPDEHGVDEAGSWYRRRPAETGDAAAMFNRGELLDERGDLDEAEIWYRRAVEEDSAPAMNNLGLLLEKRGELREAERWYRRAAELGLSTAMFYLGRLLEQRGELNEAERCYQRAAGASIVSATGPGPSSEVAQHVGRWWSEG